MAQNSVVEELAAKSDSRRSEAAAKLPKSCNSDSEVPFLAQVAEFAKRNRAIAAGFLQEFPE